MNRTDAESGRVRKRVLTNARKEQNRVAQRAYRQRQKELNNLLNLDTNQKSEKLRGLQPRKLVGGKAKSRESRDPPDGYSLKEVQEPSHELVQKIGVELQHANSEPIASTLTVPPVRSEFGSEGTALHADTTPCLGEKETSVSISPSDAEIFEVFVEAAEVNILEEGMISQFQNTEMRSQDLELDTSTWSLDPSFFQDSNLYHPSNLRIEETEPAYSSVSSRTRPDSEQRVFDEDPGEEMTTFPNHADPIANILQLSYTTIFHGTLRNAHILGITISQLMTARHLSPFYRQTTPADDPTALVASASNPSFPPHLQPTLPQIMFPHHAYLDLLPFPILRARAVSFAAVRPRLFDHRDLKRDIVVNGGLVWDMRRWSIAPWFFNKWKMLLVGEASDVWM